MKLLVDAMLGDVARLLRMCGHDAAYALDRGVESDEELRDLAAREARTLVTRDRRLAASVDGAVLVDATDADGQLRDLAAAGVDLTLAPGERCGACNGRLERADADADVPAYVSDDADPLWRCADCGQYFWCGSHWRDVERRLADR
ncbi:Mut7-C RNAse domain-containing protein [Halobacterium yunchengense]|uniref:Mut7-C RNAse domain-containing protein n=1 Tax=Halobacterium yunchengense TaxID=3108497 RepID=UPI00300B3485